MVRTCLAALVTGALSYAASAGLAPKVIKNVSVYARSGRYGGWPANHGSWAWGNEILVGFSAAYYQWLNPDQHPYDRSKPEEPFLARSLDGGETWNIESVPALVPPEGMFTASGPGGIAKDLPDPIDFTNPGFCMTLRMTEGQKGHSWFFYSYDRGKSWKGPFNFPMLGQTDIMARTDYIINGERDAMVFLTAAKQGGGEGRPFLARTIDGGLNWKFVAWIAPDPGPGFTIMPSSVRLSPTEIVTAVRHEDSKRHGPNWIDAYVTKDNGKTWQYLSRPAPDTGDKSGNPPSLIKLRDGRLALTYGHRSPPFEVRARLSSDGGKTWSQDIVLREGGGAWDIGYSRSLQRADGKIVTAYYWAAAPQKERTIEATIWDPGGTATPIEVERLNGLKLPISNYGEHGATVVLFLSTRSKKTQAAAETIQRLNNLNRRQRIQFLGVFPNPAESADEVRTFCQNSGFVFPCYRDPGYKAAAQLGATVTPEAFVIGKDARLLYRGPIGAAGGSNALATILSAPESNLDAPRIEPVDGDPLSKPGADPLTKDPYGSIHFTSELIFDKIPGAPAHHASSIAEAPNGDLLVTWYGGSYESSDDEALYMARRKKGERNWSAPEKLIHDPAHPVGNAIIFVDPARKIWILWGRMEATQPILPHTGWDAARLMYRVSNDNGKTWSQDALFPMETYGWLPRNLPITLPGGELLVPLSDERDNVDKSFFVKTKDSGKTWERSQIIPNKSPTGEQPAVAARPDGSLIAFVRLRPNLLQTESYDGGLTWSMARETELKCPDSAISLRALRNGHLLLAHNDSDRARTPLSITRSLDGGQTWSPHLALESNPGEYSYPSILQTSDGMIHVVYTYRRYSIKHAEFNEDWLEHLNRPN